MKKQIISLLVVVSFCFQSTYPLTIPMKQKRQKAMELLKRLKPKGVIARFKEAGKALEVAREEYEVCMAQNCNREDKEQLRLHRKTRFVSTHKDRLLYSQALTSYNMCELERCGDKKDAARAAEKKLGLMTMALVLAVEFGAIATVVGLAGAGAYFEAREERAREGRIWQPREAVEVGEQVSPTAPPAEKQKEGEPTPFEEAGYRPQ